MYSGTISTRFEPLNSAPLDHMAIGSCTFSNKPVLRNRDDLI